MAPPPAPSFDYYAELEVSRSATLQEITSAYRRLARVHHPDKNPNDQDAATTRFQRVQQAYETLSSTAGRNRYDTFSTSRGTCTCGHCYDDDDEDGEYYSDYDDDDDYYYDFSFGRSSHRPFFSSGQRPGGFTFGGSRFRSYEDMEKFFQEQERKEAERVKILAEERRQRELAETVRRKAKEDERKAEEEALRKAEEAWKAEERSKQEERWKEVGAVTKDEKLKMCLHSDFCTKVPQKKKFKCGLCAKKGGMMAFECPYCSSFLCQQCLTKYQKKRDNDEYSIIPKAKPKSDLQPEQEVLDEEEEVLDEAEEVSEPEPDAEPVLDPEKVSRTNSNPSTVDFKQQQKPNVLNNNTSKVPQKDNEDKYDAINGQILKKAKKNKKAADGIQIEKDQTQESDSVISVPSAGIKVNGKLGQKTTSQASPTPNGASESPQTPTPLPQTNGSFDYTTRNYVKSPVQKYKLPVNGLYTQDGYNVTPPQLSKPAPRAHGIAGLQPFPPPAPEPLPAHKSLEKEAHVNQGFNTTIPTGPSRLRKPFAHGSKPQFGFSCYICGGQHLARNCSQPRSCYNCGKTGHLAKHCIKTNAVNDSQTASSLSGPDPRMSFPDFQTEPETQTVVTKAAIKGATLARGITRPLLRQAMECFGLVTECEIDRKAGIAWAVFVEGEALRSAIAASPVAVAKGAVRISEWTGS